jgi:branched-chain amino acid transport system substrate-binding protein
LKATDLKANQLMMGYRGVKFDEKGNNILAAALLIQVQGDNYVAVWPKASATAPLTLPYTGW